MARRRSWRNRFYVGDCRRVLGWIPNDSIHCVVTSPPYWNLRDYKISPSIWGGDPECDHEWTSRRYYDEGGSSEATRDRFIESGNANAERLRKRRWKTDRTCNRCNAWKGVLGAERRPEFFIDHLVGIFREVRRVLRPDGSLWINIGDTYASGKGTCYNPGGGERSFGRKRKELQAHPLDRGNISDLRESNLKPKDLIGIPWMLALALRNDGWWLRADCIWHKTNTTPASVDDRPTPAHEYIFLLTKSDRYFFDHQAVLEQGVQWQRDRSPEHFMRRLRTVWTLSTQAYPGKHFATYPEELVATPIKASTSEVGCCPICAAPYKRIVLKSGGVTGDMHRDKGQRRDREKGRRYSNASRDAITRGEYRRETIGWSTTCEHPIGSPARSIVCDPFAGTGTAGAVAKRLGRDYLLIDKSKKFAEMAKRDRLSQEVLVF